jgi:hypothetical protein
VTSWDRHGNLSKEERERIARRRSDELMEERRRKWLEKMEQRRTNRRDSSPTELDLEGDGEA